MSANQTFIIIGLILLFILSRLFLLIHFDPEGSDVARYAQYALQAQIAAEREISFYQFHSKIVQSRTNKQKEQNSSSSLKRQKIVEYPPIAIEWLKLPARLMGKTKVSDRADLRRFTSQYQTWYRWCSFVVELMLFLVIFKTIWTLYSASTIYQQTERIIIFIAGGMCLAHLLYDRLDIILGALIVFSLTLLISKRFHYIWSFAVLGLAINFKLIPLILVPIYVVGSLPSTFLGNTISRQYLRKLSTALIYRTALISALILIWLVPFLIQYGKACIEFVAYHRHRGIQLESLYSSLILTINLVFGLESDIYHDFGSFNIRASYFPHMTTISTIVLLAALCGILILFTVKMFKLNSQTSACNANRNPKNADSESVLPIATQYPGLFINYTILFIAITILLGKVLSPQYLLWLLPLIALISHKNRLSRTVPWLFILVCVGTYLIFPVYYFTQVIEGTNAGASLIILRNVSLIIMTLFTIRASLGQVPEP